MVKLGLSRILPGKDVENTFVRQATSVGMIEKAHMSMWNVSVSTVLLLLQVMEAGLTVKACTSQSCELWFIYICIAFYLKWKPQDFWAIMM